ncbi:LysR family transcriptional regulator [Goekera deserti]|uniref:LysR family transcriptional regulator n=1 Tax=Goekera deserti TaxID=2497753 RepID=A0A7K3WE37_9ACTN|nr:LysR family transcriptional regulator [Goekera deserti]NDI46460.1 LysR family transcriptional regulator [Goekera deserti]NEL54606.1 LysR family transcriptional regulator [Goekera deserti]
MDPTVQALRCFLAVGRTRHFARAAAELHLSPSSVSEQVAGLEKQVGAPLCDRTSRRVDLTAVGAAMLPHAEEVTAAHGRLVAWAAARREGRLGDLRIGFLAGGTSAVMTPVLEAAVNRLPEWRLHLRRLGFRDAVPLLQAGEVDVALAPGPVRPAEVGLRGVELLREPRVLVVPQRHRLAGRAGVRLAEVRDEVFICASPGTDEASRWWAVDPRPDGGPPVYGPQAQDVDEVLQLVAAGLGVNIAAASAARYASMPGVAFVPLEDVEDCAIWLLVRAGDRSPGVAAFERIARTSAAALRARGGSVGG